MTNLIGDEINGYEQWLTVPGATVHLYGKGTPRPGRKMGHVTQVGNDSAENRLIAAAKSRIWPLRAQPMARAPVDISAFV